MISTGHNSEKITIRLGKESDRKRIFSIRHDVYARELGQHSANEREELSDDLDEFNFYIVATYGHQIIGFVSITPPGHNQYSIDKYISRDSLPFPCDSGLYEVRILTVSKEFRSTSASGLLMYAAFRWIDSLGGTRVVAIGRKEILSIYEKPGLESHGREIYSGDVTYELMSATLERFREQMKQYHRLLGKLQSSANWNLDCDFWTPSNCEHGGQFFDAIGVEFDQLDRRENIVNADVLDAWFPPAPEVLDELRNHLDWITRTSPPTHCEGMVRAIAKFRNIPERSVIPSAGSSNLILTLFKEWISSKSRVLILDPTYGEYSFVLEKIIGCHVDRIMLDKDNQYDVDLGVLSMKLRNSYDLVVIVNPNSPTGRYIPRVELENTINNASEKTRFWIDETYIDYVCPEESLEQFAIRSQNVVVCKSMSKAYALSGLRVAYLCAPAILSGKIRLLFPPWSVSMPGQIAAVKALENLSYYQKRWDQTSLLRSQMIHEIRALGLSVVEAEANFILCHLSEESPDTEVFINSCREQKVFLRDVSSMYYQRECKAIRIAIKNAEDNNRIIEAISSALN